MDLIVFLIGLCLFLGFRKNRIAMIVGIVLMLPFAWGFSQGFIEGFKQGYNEASQSETQPDKSPRK